jgi:hypothetical protein
LWLNGKPALHVCDHDTRFSAAKFLKGETTLHVWEALFMSWILIYHGMPEQIFTDQGSVFTSKIWKELLRANGCKIRLIPIESHNSQGLVESKHNHLQKIFQRVKTDFPGIGDNLALLYAVKARNDVANPKGLVPSMLVFGTMPRLFPTEKDSELDSRTAINHERYEAMKPARKEMTECIAQDKVKTALNSVPPAASSYVLNLASSSLFGVRKVDGKDRSFYREQWERLHSSMTQRGILDLSVSRRSSRSSQKIVTYLLRTSTKS